jgi:anaerobic ribonucleoside-triphosphate reductase activating protein
MRNLITLDELIAVIKDAKDKHGIEGVTYSGGEPTLQQNLPELTKAIQELGLGVISFTGHLYERVQEQLEGCDMVLDGAFEEAKLETKRKILGSTNQRILCLTDRYKDCADWFLAPTTKSIEINVGSSIFVNGDKI